MVSRAEADPSILLGDWLSRVLTFTRLMGCVLSRFTAMMSRLGVCEAVFSNSGFLGGGSGFAFAGKCLRLNVTRLVRDPIAWALVSIITPIL